jgi:hypothetical protein
MERPVKQWMDDYDSYRRFKTMGCNCLACPCPHHCGEQCVDCEICEDCVCKHCENYKKSEN